MKTQKYYSMTLSIFIALTLIGCGTKTQEQHPSTPAPSEISESEMSTTDAAEYVLSFSTTDINGAPVDSSIFSEKKLTVVNVWGTFCGPCIEEMPELADWAREMGDDIQLIGIVGDINGENDTQHIELAQTIVQTASVEYTNLIPNDDLDELMSNIIGVPTTFFVDQTGAIVGDPIIGANVAGCKEFAENYLAGQ